MPAIIYKATNTINQKVYTGFSENSLDNRRSSHEQSARCRFPKLAVDKAIKKYGPESFLWEVQYQSDNIEFTHRVMESYFIFHNNSHINDGWGYNCSYGGEGAGKGMIPWNKGIRGIKDSDETRKRKSESHKGKIPWSKGKKGIFSEDVLREMSLKRKGKPSPKGFAGKTHSIETREKISSALKGRKETISALQKKMKYYRVTDPSGNTYTIHGMKEFCVSNHLSRSCMTMVAQGEQKTHRGWKCEHVKYPPHASTLTTPDCS